MNASVIKDGIDRVDTGLPDQPDLGPVLARGRALRRRRRTGFGLGVAALVAAVAVPAGLLANGDDGPDLAPDPATSSSSEPTTEFGPAFGDAMTATVTALLPGASRIENSQYDHFEPSGSCCTRTAVNDPVDWSHVFSWNQAYDLPNGAQLYVNSLQYPAQLQGQARCRPDETQPDMTCDVVPTGDGRTLSWTQGTQSDDPPFSWSTSASVTSDAAGPHGMRSTVSVSVVMVTDDSWAEAQATLPDLDVLTQLASDASLVIPEPTTIPGFKVGHVSYPALP
jgi:hypothetical protein